MTSVLNVDTIAAKNGTSPVTLTKQQAAKAWVKLNQTDGLATDSFNVASVSDDGTGLGSYTFTNNMNNDSYCIVAMGGQSDFIQSNTVRTDATPDSTSGVSTLRNANYNFTTVDTKQMNTAVLGDLA